MATDTINGPIVAASGGAASDYLSTLTSPEIAVTTTATLTINRAHVCSGTSANYTVTLPAASGNAGKLVGIRMAAGLTKLITVAGNATELIDGINTRVMWAQESAVLLCDGTGWSKIGGKSRPMIAVMRLSSGSPSSAQSINSAVQTKVLLNATDKDSTGLMASTTNNRINIVRAGDYRVSGLLALVTSTSIPRFFVQIVKTGSNDIAAELPVYSSGGDVYPTVNAQGTRTLTASDYVELNAYQTSGSARFLYGDPTATTCLLDIVEIPSW